MSIHSYETALQDIQRKSAREVKIEKNGKTQTFGAGSDSNVFHMLDFLQGKVYTVNANALSTYTAFERFFKISQTDAEIPPIAQMMVIEKHCSAVNAVRSIYAVCTYKGPTHLCIPGEDAYDELEDLCDGMKTLTEIETIYHGAQSDLANLEYHWGQIREALDSYSISGVMKINKMYGVFSDLARAIPRSIELWEDMEDDT